MPDSMTYNISETAKRVKVKKPGRYRVVMLNDDFTEMDFVVMILKDIFGKSEADATAIMMAIHTTGKGICGEYSLEIAETKVLAVHQAAQEHEFPLRCIIERV